MADLFSSLNAAVRALEAQQTGLGVTGQNIANVNSPGYTRRTLTISPIPPYETWSAGGGAHVTDLRAQRDYTVERRLRLEVSAQERQETLAGVLGGIELALGQAGSSIDADLAAFFDAFATLAESPSSAVARNEVREQALALASSFRNLSGNLEVARRDADRQINSVVDDINSLVGRIAALNDTIATSGREKSLSSRDEQARLVQELSSLLDVTVLHRDDGGLDLSTGGGRPLVVGGTPYAIDRATAGPAGYLELSIGGYSIVDEVQSGRLGGLLEARDTIIPGYGTQLDELAYAVAEEVNALHTGGYDLVGNGGLDFFTFSPPVTGSSGAAAALEVNAAISADTSLIAAAGINEPGDNTVARSIAALRETRVLSGGTATLSDGWGQLVYRVGRDVRNAQAEATNRGEIVAQVEMLRDQVSGVSLDEEAAQMLRFQRAYEANARFFRLVDETLDLLMSLA